MLRVLRWEGAGERELQGQGWEPAGWSCGGVRCPCAMLSLALTLPEEQPWLVGLGMAGGGGGARGSLPAPGPPVCHDAFIRATESPPGSEAGSRAGLQRVFTGTEKKIKIKNARLKDNGWDGKKDLGSWGCVPALGGPCCTPQPFPAGLSPRCPQGRWSWAVARAMGWGRRPPAVAAPMGGDKRRCPSPRPVCAGCARAHVPSRHRALGRRCDTCACHSVQRGHQPCHRLGHPARH